MSDRTDRDALKEAFAFVLRQNRPLAKRIGEQRRASLSDELDPAAMLAEKFVQHLKLSGWELSRREPRRLHRTP